MRLKNFGEYGDPYGTIESPEFVRLLKQHDPQAWEQLDETYHTQISSVIISTLIAAGLPLEMEDDIKAWVWSRARKEIVNFQFAGRGSVFKWLCAIHKQRIAIYADVESSAYLELLRQQDNGAWSRLINLYQDYLLHIGRSRLAAWGFSLDHAHDLLQETWITARQKIGNIQPDTATSGRLLAWLCKIYENHARNYWRWFRLRDYVSTDENEALAVSLEDTIRPLEDDFFDGELRQIVAKALARIMNDLNSPMDRDIVFRRLVMGEKPIDIINRYPGDPVRIYELTKSVKRKLKVMLENYLPAQNNTNVAGE